MKIALVQSRPLRGEVDQNIENHLLLIRNAVQFKAGLIVFPELSITGYEPGLAEELACEVADERFHVFQELADAHQVTIGIGMPTRATDGIYISMILFGAGRERLLYSKRILHEDEWPYFTSGRNQPFLTTDEGKIAFGICYEALQRAHIVQAAAKKARMFIASVAKADRGLNKAYLHFPTVAKEFGMPVLMSNCVGYCDNFLSNGQTAVWNSRGELVAQLNDKTQGILVYDTQKERAEVKYLEAVR